MRQLCKTETKLTIVDLLPLLVSERTNYSVFASRTERFKRSFFSSTTTLWNDISFDIRCLESIDSFKKALLSFFNVSSYNATFDFAIDRFNAIFHTRLRLDTCALNYYLFKIGCKESQKALRVFVVFTTSQLRISFLNVHLILPLELICSPLLLVYLPTSGLLCVRITVTFSETVHQV